MKLQFDHKLISSLLLYVDHEIQTHGQAYTNYSGLFYPVSSTIQGLYAYASPFKQFCNDTSISGATVISGVYLNGHYINVGQSGLQSINHSQGTVYFSNPLASNSVISGNYAVKEFNVEITTQPEYNLLFETKYVTNDKYNQVLSGLPLDTKTSPIVFLRISDTENKPFAFNRIDNNTTRIRSLVIADNEYQRIGVCNILKNLSSTTIPIYQTTPFDRNGSYTGLKYNYTGLSLDTTYESWVMSSKIVNVANKSDSPNINKNVAIVDFEISTIMLPPIS